LSYAKVLFHRTFWKVTFKQACCFVFRTLYSNITAATSTLHTKLLSLKCIGSHDITPRALLKRRYYW